MSVKNRLMFFLYSLRPFASNLFFLVRRTSLPLVMQQECGEVDIPVVMVTEDEEGSGPGTSGEAE